MEVAVQTIVEIDVESFPLAQALYRRILQTAGLPDDFDDAGLDWYTDQDGNTFVGTPEWQVSSNPDVARLVDTLNMFNLGRILQLDTRGLVKWDGK